MIISVCILSAVCLGLVIHILHTRRQLLEWLQYLRAVKDAPERKIFVKDKGILAEINYEINDILEENRKQLLRLTKAEETNKQILTNLSHDVRTPLASLLGYLEALDCGNMKETERKEYIHTAHHKALDLKELVDILFQWFKINSNEEIYEVCETDINELTRELLIGYLPLFEGRRIALEADISDDEYPVWVDRVAYRRILNNLVNNALKHGECTRISVQIRKNDSTVMVRVGNDGAVIPKEQLPYIFERLYKCDASRSGNGNGLGLAIVNELMKAMHGRITVESREGLGTEFSLFFPADVRKK